MSAAAKLGQRQRRKIYMSKIAIVTDSNSGILQSEAKELGIFVLPMPFFIDEKLHREEIDLSQETFYQILSEDGEVSTSQPSPADITDLWDEILKSYDEIVHIPMSSGLSGSCQTAMMLADDYDGRVHVVDNQRISVTQKLAVFDAINMAKTGMSAAQIKEKLTEEKLLCIRRITRVFVAVLDGFHAFVKFLTGYSQCLAEAQRVDFSLCLLHHNHNVICRLVIYQ